jgi:hypothetical protein
MKQSRHPSRWPEDVEYLSQSCFAPNFPQQFRHLVIGPKSTPSNGDSSRRIPVGIRLIDDPRHPACGQRGKPSRFIPPSSQGRTRCLSVYAIFNLVARSVRLDLVIALLSPEPQRRRRPRPSHSLNAIYMRDENMCCGHMTDVFPTKPIRSVRQCEDSSK